MRGLAQFYAEKKFWIKKSTNEVTGHYTQIIDPNNIWVGVSGFIADGVGYHTVAMEFYSVWENGRKPQNL